MKQFNRLIIVFAVVYALFLFGINLYLAKDENDTEGRPYLVEINRLAYEIERSAGEDATALPDISACEYVQNITVCTTAEEVNQASSQEVAVRQIGDVFYRFEYTMATGTYKHRVFVMNAGMILLFVLMLCVLFYIRQKIIKPFHVLENVPYELSKGNLTIPLKEEKTRYFGRFVWGLNMLRENLADRRNAELNMHKEKKTLLLSLAHDIKTPLSVIRLNAQAIEKGIYQKQEKRAETCQKIVGKVDEIEDYLTKIMDISKDDFLDLEVICRDISLSEVVEYIRDYYKDKLRVYYIDFQVDTYDDCRLHADRDRLIEVCQNVIENAVKYGDGTQIHISFRQEEDCRLIEISNTGNLLPPEEMNHIFDSFYRGSNVGSQPGNGLGLYICRKLMHAMNGDIFVKETDGRFAVTLVVPESQ